MKIIFSRKGFDSSSGGCPNPVLPNGRLLALPIPDTDSPVTYKDISDTAPLAEIASQLSGRALTRHGAHLDPDVITGHRPRHQAWRPVLGQHGAAEGHLMNQGVGRGGLFLFFGLFRPVEHDGRRWRFVPQSRAYHALWGWLQVEERVDLTDQRPEAYAEHPHLFGNRGRSNALYVARHRLQLPQAQNLSLPGAGCFRNLGAHGWLSDPEGDRATAWRLPGWMYPAKRLPLSYHRKLSRWQRAEDGETCSLQAAARGQEFVLHGEQYPEHVSWLRRLFLCERAGLNE